MICLLMVAGGGGGVVEGKRKLNGRADLVQGFLDP